MRAAYLFFAGLYFVQGAMLAYLTNFQKPYLAGKGVQAGAIALLTSVMLVPFIAKIFLGALSDRYSFLGFGHRRPYMALGLGTAAICFIVLMLVDPADNYPLFFGLMVTSAIGMALFDTCADGYAIDVSSSEEAGPVQSFMMGGKAAGYILLSAGFGWIVGKSGYVPVFGVIAGVALAVLAWVLVAVREPERLAPRARAKFSLRAFCRDLGLPALAFTAYGIVYSIFSFGTDGLVTLFLHKQLAVSTEMIGAYGSARGLGAILGAALAGWASLRYGKKRTAYAALAALALAGVCFFLLRHPKTSISAGIVWGTAWGFQETVFVMLAMVLAERALPATVFALLMMSSNIGTAIGEGLATSFSATHGFPPVFLAFALGCIAVVPLLWLVFRLEPRLAKSR